VLRSLNVIGPYAPIAAPTTNAYANKGLSPSTAYYYVVQATTAAGTSIISDEADATTLSLVAAPANLTATGPTASEIDLSWDPVVGATRYTVYRSASSGGPYAAIAAVAPGTTTYAHKGLPPSATYYYVVRATTSAGISGNSNQANATTQALPPAPANLAAVAVSSSQINLTWDPVAGATRYTLLRALSSGGPYTAIAAVAGTSYANRGLAAGTTYFYLVRATTAAGLSPISNQAFATTL
jgi:fibronectin type 3 domain-containing protein